MVSGKDFPALARALARLGVEPESAEVWFHTLDSPPRGWPIGFEAVEPESGLRVQVSRHEPAHEAHRVGLRVFVKITCDSEQAEVAGRLMRRILLELEQERRMECNGAEHFLGNPADFAWSSRDYPTALLAAIHRHIEATLRDWTVVQTARAHKSREVRKILVRNEQGEQVSVYSDVRYFMRWEDRWLVLELSQQQVATQVNLASVGTPPGFEAEFLGGLDRALKDGRGLGPLRISADGSDLALERGYGWDDLFLAEELKALLQDETVGFFGRRDLYQKMDLPFRRGVLLHGPPGSGKTLVGKILAHTLSDVTFIWVTAGHVERSNSVAQIFGLARFSRRAVLFFEDLDFYASRRDRMMGGAATLGELLVQLDGMQGNDGLLVVATTNDLEAIEPALKERPSRFDRVIEIGSSPPEVRAAHLLHLLAPYGVDGAAIDRILTETNGFSGAQLQELALRARMAAAQRGRDRVDAEDLRRACQAAAEYRAPKGTIGFDR